eukprot:CAMPEP_0170133268 /NCGR_PEP_ID=MMETSP0033_2-20121228/1178_1 /TAXON_ID=195969 /ORGANISM="Dolichomastix tenuilepis, Strain CCMP3274" /LENGTH=517 /DNA_ID=CAMNT_0010368739 /DNA_START=21 /DNA_END=1574 /DNA_ORIENTATION=+
MSRVTASASTSRAVRVARRTPSSRRGEPLAAGFFSTGLSGTELNKASVRVASGKPQVAVAAQRPNAQAATVTSAPQQKVSPRDASSVCSLILGGGKGSRLYPLTKTRSKPAVPIGGAYRLIDVPMSNCINSGIGKVYILTQFNSTSLNRHLSRTYNFGNSMGGFVEVLAATQTPGTGGKEWFNGTADAVRQYSWLLTDIKNKDIHDVVILSGDHLYKMNYMDFVAYHREQDADITVAALPQPEETAKAFGLMKIDGEGTIVDFAEKPEGEALKAMAVDTTVLGLSKEEAEEKPYIASMGIYVFKKDSLNKLLNEECVDSLDFGSEIIPYAAQKMTVKAYLFNDYWEDIGTIKSFFESNLALAKEAPPFEFYSAESPIYTSPRYLPPAAVFNVELEDAIVSHGATLTDCTVKDAVVGLRSRVCAGATVEHAMIIGADFYETEEERVALEEQGKVPVGIGEGSVIKNAIIDKNARVGKNCTITNAKGVDEELNEEMGYYIRSGIVTVFRNAVIPDGTTI